MASGYCTPYGAVVRGCETTFGIFNRVAPITNKGATFLHFLRRTKNVNKNLAAFDSFNNQQRMFCYLQYILVHKLIAL
jgi:hypothetical protein